MNSALKWKLVGGFLLAFLAGAAAGSFIATRESHHHRHADRGHGPHLLADRMQSRLDLTPEQMEKARPIFAQAAAELEKIRAETGKRVQAVMAEANRALAPMLTEAQRGKLNSFRKSGRDDRRPEKAHGRRRGGRPPKEADLPGPERSP
ncbi:MAG: hypothetical protein M3Q46_05600 [Verrucomicrobiota bacterium]|nr:hypothetical protein [Verrucomicrobiota bacterium]